MPRFDPPTRDRIVAEIYEAAIDSVLWSLVIEHLAPLFRANMVGMSVFPMLEDGVLPPDLENMAIAPDEHFSRTLGLDPESHKAYLEDWIHHDDLTALAIGISRTENKRVIVRQEIASDAAFEKSPFYQEFVKPQHYFHTIGAIGCSEPAHSGYSLSINRPKRSGAFAGDESNFLSSLVPHVERSLRIHRKLTRLHFEIAVQRHAFQSLGYASFLVAGSMRVAWMDEAADELVRQGRYLAIRNGKLRLLEEGADRQLKSLVQQGITNGFATESSAHAEPRIFLQTAGSTGPRAVWVLPQRRQPDLAQKPAVLVVVESRRDAPAEGVDFDLLKSRYGLTTAECRISILLVNGFTPREISEKLNRSLGTVRNQLKGILHKTDSRRQTELVSKILRMEASR
jgi:DNA-binding CsgD family transcriptional regulator